MKKLVILSCACAALLAGAYGADIVYDGVAGVTDLTAAEAWVGGVVPGTNDVAVFDGDVPESLSLGVGRSRAHERDDGLQLRRSRGRHARARREGLVHGIRR